jgi:LytS/YehU family sensor histidine kinase
MSAADDKKAKRIYLILAIVLIIVAATYLVDYFAIKIFVLLLVPAAFYIYHIVQTKRTRKALAEQTELYQLKINLIKSSLDPHFLFNAINSVSYSMNKNEVGTAQENLSALTKLMRTALTDIDGFGHELSEEISFIKSYLALEKFRFNEKFNYTVKVMPYVNDMAKVPAFLIFCFVENALKKGVLSKADGGNVVVNIDEDPTDKTIIARVSDDGLYRNLADKANQTHNTNVANALIDKLNAQNEQKISVNYSANGNTNGEPQGCVVELKIPAGFSYAVKAL